MIRGRRVGQFARATIAREPTMQHSDAHATRSSTMQRPPRSRRHGHGHAANERSVGLAALLTGGFMVAEVVGGIFAGSLALLADAGHMLTDFAASRSRGSASGSRASPPTGAAPTASTASPCSSRSSTASRCSRSRPGSSSRPCSGCTRPSQVLGGSMLWIALAGLAVNVVAFLVLRTGDKDNLNIRAAVLHVVGDLLGSVAAVSRRARDPRDGLDADRSAAVDRRRADHPALGLARRRRQRPHPARRLAAGRRLAHV